MRTMLVNILAFSGLIFASSAFAVEMPSVIKKNNCTSCHAVDKKLVGPAFMDVSKKYKGVNTYTFKGKEYPLEEGLMMKVSNGGSGNWGGMAMPPIDPSGKKQDEVKAMVEFVLGLAK